MFFSSRIIGYLTFIYIVSIFNFLDAGAKVATDWAIARSLSQLIKAEDAGKLKESQAQLDVQQEGDEEDDEKDDDDDNVERSV